MFYFLLIFIENIHCSHDLQAICFPARFQASAIPITTLTKIPLQKAVFHLEFSLLDLFKAPVNELISSQILEALIVLNFAE